MIKINLIREGRAAVRGATAPGAATMAAGPSNANNVLIVALLVAGLVVSGGYWFYKYSVQKSKESEVAIRKAEAQKLEKIIAEVEAFQARKDSLQRRIDLIKQLKANQKGPVRIMDRISQDLPDLVWLDNMTVKGSSISLTGRALNPNAIATFVENIKGDELFDEPEVNEISKDGTAPPVFRYSMNFNFRYATPVEPAAAGAAQPGAAEAPAPTPGT